MADRREELGVVQSVQPGRRALRIQGPAGVTNVLERLGWIRLATSGGERRLKLESVRQAGDDCVVELVPGVTRETVAGLRGSRVLITSEERREVAPGHLNPREVVGMGVFDESGAEIGEVTALYEGKAHDMAEIRRVNGESVVIPLIPPVVAAVDTQARRLILGDWTPYSVES